MDTAGNQKNYTYQSEDAYYIDNCIQKVEFARYQVSSQLESAIARKKEQGFELKLFIGILAAYLFIYHIALAMAATGMVVGVIVGNIIVILCLIGCPFVAAVCFYKIIKSGLIMIVNGQSSLGAWLAGRYALPLYKTEMQTCYAYLEKYRILLEDLEKSRNALAQGQGISGEFLKERMESVELNPQIEAVSPNYGKLHRFAAVCAVLITVLLVFGFILFRKFS